MSIKRGGCWSLCDIYQEDSVMNTTCTVSWMTTCSGLCAQSMWTTIFSQRLFVLVVAMIQWRRRRREEKTRRGADLGADLGANSAVNSVVDWITNVGVFFFFARSITDEGMFFFVRADKRQIDALYVRSLAVAIHCKLCYVVHHIMEGTYLLLHWCNPLFNMFLTPTVFVSFHSFCYKYSDIHIRKRYTRTDDYTCHCQMYRIRHILFITTYNPFTLYYYHHH